MSTQGSLPVTLGASTSARPSPLSPNPKLGRHTRPEHLQPPVPVPYHLQTHLFPSHLRTGLRLSSSRGQFPSPLRPLGLQAQLLPLSSNLFFLPVAALGYLVQKAEDQRYWEGGERYSHMDVGSRERGPVSPSLCRQTLQCQAFPVNLLHSLKGQ